MLNKIYNNTFLRYLIPYMIIFLLPIVVLGVTIHAFFINPYIEDILRQNLEIPQKIQSAVDMQISQLDSFAYQISLNPDFTIKSRKKMPLVHLDITRTLSAFSSTNEFIKEVFFYTGEESNTYYGVRGLYNPEILFQSIYHYENLTHRDFSAYANKNENHTWIGETKIDQFSGQKTSYVTYIRPLYSDYDWQENSFLLFMINRNSFDRVVGSANVKEGAINVITNTNGDIIYSSSLSSFYDEIQNLIRNYEEFTDKGPISGWRTAYLNEQEMYTNRIDSDTGLIYLTLMPTEVMLQSINRFQENFSWVYFILVTSGFLLVLIVSKHIYKPIKRLAESIGSIKTDMGSTSNIIEMAEKTIYTLNQSSLLYRQEQMLLHLLNNDNTMDDAKRLKAAQLHLSMPYFRVAILCIKQMRETVDNTDLLSVVKTAFLMDKSLYIVKYVESNYFILVMTGASEDQEHCSDILKKGADFLHQKNLDVQFYIGNAYYSLDLLRQSFREAKTAFINRNYNDESYLHFYDTLSTNDSINQQLYPSVDIIALCNAIEQENPILIELMSNKLQQHIEQMESNSFTQKCVCYEVINRIFHMMDAKSPGWMRSVSEDIVTNLSMSSVEDLMQIFQMLCNQMILDIKALPARPHKLSMKDAISYIDTHFSDPSFSVKRLAADFQISTSNFSHQFKKSTGITVSEYINRKKIQYAKKLFQETDSSVAEVAEKVGYYHTSSFIRKYKQEEGITPGEYLKQIKG